MLGIRVEAVKYVNPCLICHRVTHPWSRFLLAGGPVHLVSPSERDLLMEYADIPSRQSMYRVSFEPEGFGEMLQAFGSN